MFYQPSSNPQLNLMALAQAGSVGYGAKAQAARDKERKATLKRYENMTFNELLEVAPASKKEGQFA